MMIYPPITELVEKTGSRYSLVIEIAKRARQLAAGAKKMTDAEDKSPVTLAVDEIFEGSVYEVEDYYFEDDSEEEIEELEEIEENIEE